MDKSLRNTLRNVVTQCRHLLEDAVSEMLEGQFGIFKNGKIEADERMGHLSAHDREYRAQLIAHFDHIQASGIKPPDAVAQLTREAAYTHLNRLCAYKMMEERDLIREAVSRGMKSPGFMFYLADDADAEQLWKGGQQETAYRMFLEWQASELSKDIGVLFSPNDPANRLFPPHRTLNAVLDLINSDDLKDIWTEDEAIGWVYQYFTPKELRDQARKESQAPRNSYELSFRNQFFTPRYVVEFLTDNTLGRTWYEMRRGQTTLADRCKYLIRRPDEVFLAEGATQTGDRAEDDPDTLFLAGKSDEMPPFLVMHQVPHGLEPVPDEPNTFTMPYYDPDDATFRLTAFAHKIRPFDWGTDPRKEGWLELLENLATGAPDDPVEGKTGDIWDCLLAIVRADRFSDGLVDSHSLALTRIANEIRRRLLLSRKADTTQEERQQTTVLIPYRAPKDPRTIRVIDPACGSGHFLLYCFDLFEVIYAEAYDDPELGRALQDDYPDRTAYLRAVPGLILECNLHGIDIDLRATQIAALALWLRAQRAYSEMKLKRDARPSIRRSNIVCAEPMPGERDLLDEFTEGLTPKVLGGLVRRIFDRMQLAGEAGSLLQIDDEIAGAITDARRAYHSPERLRQQSLMPDFEITRYRQGEFDFSDMTDDQFWMEFFSATFTQETKREGAESRLVEALREYAESTGNGASYRRRLFADDAAQGFAFVDVCRKQYDVALMNPPFGAASTPSKAYIEENYRRTKNDVYAAFVERWLSKLSKGGLLGALTSRTGFFLSSFQKWREEILLKEARPTVFADLGQGVLDAAMVETAAYCIERSGQGDTIFFRLLMDDDKADVLAQSVTTLLDDQPNSKVYAANPESFAKVPSSPFAYWVPVSTLDKFTDFGLYEEFADVKQGLQTKDNERFVRAWWEVPSNKLDQVWQTYAKGGEYIRYYLPFPLVVDWSENAQSVYKQREGQMVVLLTKKRDDYVNRPGITYSKRSQIGFSARILPKGSIFSANGPGVFPSSSTLLYYDLAFLNNSFSRACLEFLTSFGSYSEGSVGSLPYPVANQTSLQEISSVTRHIVAASRELFINDETLRSHLIIKDG